MIPRNEKLTVSYFRWLTMNRTHIMISVHWRLKDLYALKSSEKYADNLSVLEGESSP
jgi:hypothetical protein